jgi:hypothetical protein
MGAQQAQTVDDQITQALEPYLFDAAGWVRFAFPWGESGRLVDEEGPDVWQAQTLRELSEGMLAQARGKGGAVRIAVRSGHNIGKSTLIAWLILWFLSTRPYCQLVVTANTSTQLETKTWRELAKWHQLLFYSHWFTWQATKMVCNWAPETWYASAIPWSKERAAAFAGTHEKYVLFLFDEASEIPEIIWETAEGSMSDEHSAWLVFGNPTLNHGRFFECWNRFRHRWLTHEIDARTTRRPIDKTEIHEWIKDYGEDSDFVRIRVKGQAPRASSMQFIGQDLVDAAVKREHPPMAFHKLPLILGVDVAWYGDDESIILQRQGPQVLKIESFRGVDPTTLAGTVALRIRELQPDGVFVDIVGMGAGVLSNLRAMGYQFVYAVNVATAAADPKTYFNKRAECWGRMKGWIKEGGAIPDDAMLKTDLTGIQYGFEHSGRLQLERKEDMKKRGLASPDRGDALAMTFAEMVVKRNPVREPFDQDDREEGPYDPFARARERLKHARR